MNLIGVGAGIHGVTVCPAGRAEPSAPCPSVPESCRCPRGHVGCCDSSKNKHATRHFHAVKHPLVRSIEPGESWVWCYIDEVTLGELD
jgi:hypothetical protein